MASTTAVNEVVHIPGTISGSSIVRDLLNRIADKLSRNCDLRPVDVYSGYSYRVTLELQLHGVYPTTVTAEVVEGRIDPKLEVQQVDFGSDIRAVEPEPSNLERPVDGVIETPAAPARTGTALSDKATLWEPDDGIPDADSRIELAPKQSQSSPPRGSVHADFLK